jgi:excisionase family DNA binding protein
MIEKRMLNTEEMAQLMGISVRTIRYLLKNGRFPISPTVRVGRIYLWDKRAVDQYLDKASAINSIALETEVVSEIKRSKMGFPY